MEKHGVEKEGSREEKQVRAKDIWFAHAHKHCLRSPLKLSSLTTGCIIRTCLHIIHFLSLFHIHDTNSPSFSCHPSLPSQPLRPLGEIYK